MNARESTDVVVIGSGPNGLAAAVTMARAGLGVHLYEAEDTLGGGARTLDLELAGHLRHDVCSAVHPLASASPFFAEFDLAARGVDLTAPAVSYAQPLDGAQAGLAFRDLEHTADQLGADGRAWHKLFAPLLENLPAVLGLALGDMRTVPPQVRTPGDLLTAISFGLRTLNQGSPAWNLPFTEEVAPALLTGVASHGVAPVRALAPAALGLVLGALAHAGGWTIPVGGSQVITDALVADLQAHGGIVHTATPIHDYRQLPRARAYFLDTAPTAAAGIWGDRLPARQAGRLHSFRHGNAVGKVDFVLSEPVPWAAGQVGDAATVHVGGTRAEMARAEAQIAAGRHAPDPVVLVSDPTVADPARGQEGLRPLWTYAHVPAGSSADVTEAITAQIERFAPGFRDVVVDSRCVPADRMSQMNANYIGGDIGVGRLAVRRIVAGPARGWNPYAIGIPGVYLCSSATPPAPGVHGMCGQHAARWALSERFSMKPPSLAPAP
ncbi:MAG TPA: NAD(P)/FAD-dependent oxidoreductase [Beutenbergiaceae bacterium]|nr:NAD(P)/FAD-dependent oxidoreductase [Beutenbergiaceae bacterium]